MKAEKNKDKYSLNIIRDLFNIWLTELKRVVHDQGVLIFFILVPLLYPLLYAFIYTGETVHEVPAIYVDESSTSLSRDFIRRVDATAEVNIVKRCSDMEEAKEEMKRQKAYGLIRIPNDFSYNINRGEQAHVGLYCDMSGLLYYKALLQSCTEVSLDMNTEIQIKRMGNTTNREDIVKTSPLDYEYITMFNPTNGFASFVLPAVLILIIQQTLLLGIGMINGSARERGTFHQHLTCNRKGGTLRLVLGKALCYLMVYALCSTWLLVFVPRLFSLVQIPQAWDLLAFMLPYILSCIFFAMTLSVIIYQREVCMPIYVFTSVPLLFISGISWPGASVPEFWKIISWIFPSTFGINGFVRINSLGALLPDVSTEYIALWIQTLVYFCTACISYRLIINDSILKARQLETEKQTDNNNQAIIEDSVA